MKRSFYILLALFPLLSAAQTGIRFETGLSWQQIKEKAKAENKYIFVDGYATWCAPCRAMDQQVYTDGALGQQMTEKFIAVKVQMDTTRLDNVEVKKWYADAHELMRNAHVTAFPTFLFFFPEGQLVHKGLAFKEVAEFRQLLAEALDPGKQFYTLIANYRDGRLDTASLKRLARMANALGEEKQAEQIANDYINKQSNGELLTADNIWFVYDFTKSSKEKGFALFRDSAERISKIDKVLEPKFTKYFVEHIIYDEEIKPYTKTIHGKPDWKTIKKNIQRYGPLGQQTYTEFWPGVIFRTEIEPALKTDPDWNHILPLIRQQHAGKAEELLVGSSVVYYLNGIAFNHTEKNCKNLIPAALYYQKEFPAYLKPGTLNDWAWLVFGHSKDQAELNTALSWSKQALTTEPGNPAYLDTYANLLYKLGRVEEGISFEQKAANQEQADAANQKREADSQFLKTLEKMKKGTRTWDEKL